MALRWPPGIHSAGVSSGIKGRGALDLGLLVVDRPAAWAGTFTKNAAAAASVTWSRSLLGKPVRAIAVNSGNANACTGTLGATAVEETARAAAAVLGCRAQEVLIASTGPIGVQLPVEKLAKGLPTAGGELSRDTGTFSRCILTTDTGSKSAVAHERGFRIVGVAKGAAMLAPNMATMLAFIATDAALDGGALQRCLSPVVARSFDRICVDACESTNDSVFLMSSGHGKAPAPGVFAAALAEVCTDLAEQMVRDAEGGSHLVRVVVSGATDEETAAALGRGVAASALWRAALHGSDPNWGRVLAALGAVDRELDLQLVSVSIGGVPVFAEGAPAGSSSAAADAMKAQEFTVSCCVGRGGGSAEILTSDLSPEYVSLNATGTS